MFESGAGLLHIARKSDKLMPSDPTSQAQTQQWIFAALNSIEMVTVPWWFLKISGDADNQLSGWMGKRLDQLDRRMTRMERDLGISVEMLAVFVRFWLTTNPPLPEPAQAAARAQAGERYDAFVAALGRRLAKGPKLRQEISEDVSGVADAE